MRPRTHRSAESRRPAAFWLEALLACCLGWAGLVPLTFNTPFVKEQEATYALDIRSAMRGNYLVINAGEDRALGRKPPLYFWLGALCSIPAGRVSEVSARMPAVIAGGLLAGLLCTWTGSNLGRRAGWLTLLAMFSMSALVSNLVTVEVDSILVLALYAALASMRPALTGAALGRWRILAGGLALGAGILSKGPLALVLVAGSLAIYTLIARAKLAKVHLWSLVYCGLLGLGLAAAWYVPASLVAGAQFGRVAMEENLGHFLPAALGGTGEAARPWYFIGAHLIGGSMPMVLFVAAALTSLCQEPRDSRRDFLWSSTTPLWLVLIFFSIASAKREVYVLPALPALAILIGALFDTVIEGDRLSSNERWTGRLLVAGLAAELAIITALLIVATDPDLIGRIAARLRLHPTDLILARLATRAIHNLAARTALILALVIAAAPLSYGMVRRRAIPAVYGTMLFAILTSFGWVGFLRPALARARSEKSFLQQIVSIRPDVLAHLMVWSAEDTEAEFYLNAPLPTLSNLSAAKSPCFLLYYEDDPPPRLSSVVPILESRPGEAGARRRVLAEVK